MELCVIIHVTSQSRDYLSAQLFNLLLSDCLCISYNRNIIMFHRWLKFYFINVQLDAAMNMCLILVDFMGNTGVFIYVFI